MLNRIVHSSCCLRLCTHPAAGLVVAWLGQTTGSKAMNKQVAAAVHVQIKALEY